MNLNYIYPTDILGYLEKNGQVTVAEIARDFECGEGIVRSRLKELRYDGQPIIHDHNGLMLVDREMVETMPEVAMVFEKFVGWFLGSVKGMASCAKPNQKLLPALRRSLKEIMTKEERKAFSSACLRYKLLVDAVDIDDE